jgi:hypothetical protein
MAIKRVTQYLVRLLSLKDLAGAVEDELENISSKAVSKDELGVDGVFTTADTPAKTVTVTKGIITRIQ